MKYKKRLIPLIGVILIFALAGCANFSQNNFDTLEQVQAAEATKITLIQAVNVADRTAKGTPVEIRFRIGSAGTYYVIKLIADNATNYVALDAKSGSILKIDNKWHQVRWLKRRNRSERLHIRYSEISLIDAIAQAEKTTGGKAIELTVDDQRYPQYFLIKSVRNGTFSTTKIRFHNE